MHADIIQDKKAVL